MFLPPWFVCVETLVILTTSRGLESTFNQPFRRFLGNSANLASGTFSQAFSLWSLCEGSSRRVLIVVGFIYLNLWWHSSQSPCFLPPKKTLVYLPFTPDKHHPKNLPLCWVMKVPEVFSGIRSHKSKASLLARFVHQVAKYRDPLFFRRMNLFVWGWNCLGSNKKGGECSEVQGDKRCEWCFFMFFHILMYDSYTHNRHDMQI